MLKATVTEALATLRTEGAEYARLLSEDCGDIGFYRPRPTDTQGPHLRDEVYIIASGHGMFACNGESRDFAPGDVFFVPRAVEHHFANFSDDFSAWVIFFGAAPSRQQVA